MSSAILWPTYSLCLSGELTEDPAKLKRAVQLSRMSREEILSETRRRKVFIQAAPLFHGDEFLSLILS